MANSRLTVSISNPCTRQATCIPHPTRQPKRSPRTSGGHGHGQQGSNQRATQVNRRANRIRHAEPRLRLKAGRRHVTGRWRRFAFRVDVVIIVVELGSREGVAVGNSEDQCLESVGDSEDGRSAHRLRRPAFSRSRGRHRHGRVFRTARSKRAKEVGRRLALSSRFLMSRLPGEAAHLLAICKMERLAFE